MAATNSTTNLGLPQWEATDKPERTDFNTAMSDIDNTVAAHMADYATQIALKANKAIPEYLNATLQNGWTGTIEYTKNSLGVVYVKFKALGTGIVTYTTIIATLPIGYRPPAGTTINIPINKTNVGPYDIQNGFSIDENGSIRLMNPLAGGLTANISAAGLRGFAIYSTI